MVEVVGRECPLFSLHVVLVLYSTVVFQGGRESRGREKRRERDAFLFLNSPGMWVHCHAMLQG